MCSTYWAADSLCLPWKFMNFKWKESLLWIPTFVEFYNKILKFTQKKNYLNASNLHQGQFTVFLKILFSCLLLAALGLCCCEWAFSSCGERGLLRCSAQVSRCSGFFFWSTGSRRSGFSSCSMPAQQLRLLGSRALGSVLWCMGSVATFHIRGIFWDKGLNPCYWHWQADSYHCTTRQVPEFIVLLFWNWLLIKIIANITLKVIEIWIWGFNFVHFQYDHIFFHSDFWYFYVFFLVSFVVLLKIITYLERVPIKGRVGSTHVIPYGGFPHSLVSKESACNAGDLGSISGSGRFSGEGNGNPLQYSCLENPMDREDGLTI